MLAAFFLLIAVHGFFLAVVLFFGSTRDRAANRMLSFLVALISVQILLHAFLPHKFIDHTHANAVLSLTNQKDGEACLRRRPDRV